LHEGLAAQANALEGSDWPVVRNKVCVVM